MDHPPVPSGERGEPAVAHDFPNSDMSDEPNTKSWREVPLLRSVNPVTMPSNAHLTKGVLCQKKSIPSIKSSTAR
jgi:hypothetical protein